MTPMPFDDLEAFYEALASAVDRASPANESLFLAKLALALAHRLGNHAAAEAAIAEALQDLPQP